MDDEERKSELGEYVSDILRPKRKGDLEKLLATELALATYSADPLQKIRHILEAYFLLNEEEKPLIVSKPEDQDEIHRLYVVALGLLNITTAHDSVNSDRAVIPFGFPSSRAHKYLGYFTNIVWDLSNYFKEFGAVYKAYMEKRNKDNTKAYFHYFALYLGSGDASLGLCLTVKSLFIQYVMPKTLEMLRAIYTQFVSPETWTETMTSFSSKKSLIKGG